MGRRLMIFHTYGTATLTMHDLAPSERLVTTFRRRVIHKR
ncbi:hypothetical protein IW256_006270 [Actinomadura viridis]|uniref:Uncharacterized protein n=1 Tax=Actinomadura viridis TaxID=58110 RepID=A0A931DQH7_9ACTN|nr:hypothetical protein [Actinomadura viridis]